MSKWLVLGDGPSANLINNLKPSIPVIATHHVFASQERTGIADYVIINDILAYYLWRLQWPTERMPMLVLLESLSEKAKPTVPYMTFRVDYPNSGQPLFSDSGPLNGYAANTGVLAIQWAFQRGAREIGLLGMDLYYSDSGQSHACGELAEGGLTSSAAFTRTVQWFEIFSRRFRSSPKIFTLNPDPKSPLTGCLDYFPLAEFIK